MVSKRGMNRRTFPPPILACNEKAPPPTPACHFFSLCGNMLNIRSSCGPSSLKVQVNRTLHGAGTVRGKRDYATKTRDGQSKSWYITGKDSIDPYRSRTLDPRHWFVSSLGQNDHDSKQFSHRYRSPGQRQQQQQQQHKSHSLRPLLQFTDIWDLKPVHTISRSSKSKNLEHINASYWRP